MLLDDETGALGASWQIRVALGGAVPADPVLVTVLATVHAKERSAQDQAQKVVEHEAEQVGDGQWAVQGVADPIAATSPAVTAAVTASTVATATTRRLIRPRTSRSGCAPSSSPVGSVAPPAGDVARAHDPHGAARAPTVLGCT